MRKGIRVSVWKDPNIAPVVGLKIGLVGIKIQEMKLVNIKSYKYRLYIFIVAKWLLL